MLMPHRDSRGFDIIGDIHGCATDLVDLLSALGYQQSGDGTYRHRRREAIFVGDLIDRGPEQRRVLQIVKAMVDDGSARMVLGNHEFNALAYAAEWPVGSSKYLRPHDDPENPWSAKNEAQHEAFLTQLTVDEQAHYLEWFWTQPLWLDLGDVRVVHACWHQDSIDVLRTALGGNRFTDFNQLVDASTAGDPLYVAVETLLKGPEISLTAHGQQPYLDKDGHSRQRARVRWWNNGARTLRDLAEMGGGFSITDGVPYPELPTTEVSAEHRSHVYEHAIPVFYGHYWRRGEPEYLHDWTDYTACVDFSAVKGGALTAYRWSGESRIDAGNFIRGGSGKALSGAGCGPLKLRGAHRLPPV